MHKLPTRRAVQTWRHKSDQAYAAWLVAAGIVLVAAWLRLWHLDLTVFEIDEAALVRLAEDLVRLGRLPLSGPMTSIGIPSAPHFIYFLAPIVAISRDPAFVAGGVAVANLAAVVGVAWLGWRWFGSTAGLISAVLFATSPWAVFASRRIWQPDLLPPLAVLLLAALELGVHRRRAWWAAASLPIVAFGTLVHPAFGVFVPFLLVPVATLVLLRRPGPLLVGIGLAALIVAPFLVHEVQTHWIDIPNYRYYSSLHTFVDLDSSRYALVLATGLAAPHDAGVPPLDHVWPEWLVTATAGLETALLAISIVMVLATVLRRSRSEFSWTRSIALLVWLLWPIALTIRHAFPLQAHYLLVIYPAPFLIIGAAYRWMSRPGRQWQIVQQVFLAGTVATALLQGIAVTSVIQHLAVTEDACYGPALPTASAKARDILDLASQVQSGHISVELDAGDALPVAYLVRGHVPEVDLAGVGSVGLGPAFAQPLSTTGTHTLLAGAGPRDVVYDNGVQLLDTAYAAQPAADQSAHLAIRWVAGQTAPPNRPLVWGISLRDPAGQVAYAKSGVDHLPGALRGQTIVSWFSIDPPEALAPGAYTLRLQLVDSFDSTPVAFKDAGGGSALEWSAGPVPIAPPVRCS